MLYGSTICCRFAVYLLWSCGRFLNGTTVPFPDEERRLSSPQSSSRGKTEAFEFNSEIPRVSHTSTSSRFRLITARKCLRIFHLDYFHEFRPITPRKCLRMPPRKCLRIFHLDYFDEFRPIIPRKCLRMPPRKCLQIIRVCPILAGYHVGTTLIPVWFGHSWLASICPACRNEFLENFEEKFLTQSNRLVRHVGCR